MEINATLNEGRGNQRLQKLKRLNLARILEICVNLMKRDHLIL